MATQTVDGALYAKMLMGGAAVLAKYINELNTLNVFPVADGDTGTNMSRTIEGGLRQAGQSDDLSAFSGRFSRGALLSARGNSGVILSQIFAGIGERLEGLRCADVRTLADAYKNGIAKSYAAVQNPTEGTILTVFRESAQYAADRVKDGTSVEAFYEDLLDEAQRSLAATPEKLPVLREANVVDSGAAGYLYIARGMYEALTGASLPEYSISEAAAPAQEVNIDLFTRSSKLTFGYCTEFMLRLAEDKVDPDGFDINTVLSDLSELGGESVVAYKTGDIVKVHVHTFTPGRILERMQRYGEFLTVKVENMQLGHTEKTERASEAQKPYCVVAVATGEAMKERFRSMGADVVVEGGQTANPSTQDFIDAFKACDSKSILVLPNNKNIFLAAQQAAQLYKDACVRVVETKNLMQGYGALNVLTPGIEDMDALCESALRAAQGVKCCEVTRAVRDACIYGVEVRAGQYMALSDGKICAAADTPEQAALGMIENEDMDLSEIVTVFAGRDVNEEAAEELKEKIEERCPDCDVKLLPGGQDVYDYLIAIE